MFGGAQKAPLYIVVAHHWSIVGVGIANALVWYCTRRVNLNKAIIECNVIIDDIFSNQIEMESN